MFGLGFQEILIILVVALVLFGAKRLPGAGKAIGQSIREFKKAIQGEEKNGGDKSEDGDKEK